MSYEFLHHLTQATLPVVVYDRQLVEQLGAYEIQRLLIISRPKSQCLKIDDRKGVQVVKVTRAGHRAVYQHLKASKIFSEKSVSS